MRTKKLNLISLLASALALSACGNYGAARPVANSEPEEKEQATLRSSATEGDDSHEYECPSEANIEPRWDEWMDGSNFFKACTQKDDASAIRLHGKTATSDTVCVFPAQTDQSQGAVALLNPSGSPIFSCLKAQTASGDLDSGIEYLFKGLSYDAIFVVEMPVRNAMIQCLTVNQGGRSADFSLCPNFSFGKIR